MLNFYVVSAGPDMVDDPERIKFRASPLQRKIQKNYGPSEDMGFT